MIYICQSCQNNSGTLFDDTVGPIVFNSLKHFHFFNVLSNIFYFTVIFLILKLILKNS